MGLTAWIFLGGVFLSQLSKLEKPFIGDLLIGLGVVVSICLWCLADAREKQIAIWRGHLILLIFLPWIGLPSYLFKSRGMKLGFVAIVKGILLLFCLRFISAAGSGLFGLWP